MTSTLASYAYSRKFASTSHGGNASQDLACPQQRRNCLPDDFSGAAIVPDADANTARVHKSNSWMPTSAVNFASLSAGEKRQESPLSPLKFFCRERGKGKCVATIHYLGKVKYDGEPAKPETRFLGDMELEHNLRQVIGHFKQARENNINSFAMPRPGAIADRRICAVLPQHKASRWQSSIGVRARMFFHVYTYV